MNAFGVAHFASDSGEFCDFGGDYNIGIDANVIIVCFLYDVDIEIV